MGLALLVVVSEIAETRIKDVRDELKEGDQILVKVLGLEGNKIKLSRKAVLKEQRPFVLREVSTAPLTTEETAGHRERLDGQQNEQPR